jgi:hypothetical protein
MDAATMIVPAAQGTRITYWDRGPAGAQSSDKGGATVVAWAIVTGPDGFGAHPITANNWQNEDLNAALRQGRLQWAVEGERDSLWGRSATFPGP